MRLSVALVAVALVAVPGCGGDDDGGVPNPEDVLACLTDEHGLRAEFFTAVGDEGEPITHSSLATDEITVITPDSAFGSTDYLSIYFYANAEDAKRDRGSGPGSGSIAETVRVDYVAERFPLRGPRALESVKDCVGG